MATYVSPTRNFQNDAWSSLRLLLQNPEKVGERKYLFDLYGGHDGLDLKDLTGVIPNRDTTTNSSLVVNNGLRDTLNVNSEAITALSYWAYPNGEFSPVQKFNISSQFYSYSAGGNPNGGTDYVGLMPTQLPPNGPTIPPYSGPNSPNSTLGYVRYRSSISSSKTGWSQPQYYRSAYLASDMQCSISSQQFTTLNTGTNGNFKTLLFENGYKLLTDGVSVKTNSQPGDGDSIFVTCNPGIAPRDSSSIAYTTAMTNYCGNSDTSFYKDSRFNADPNPNRTDDEGNPLGFATLDRWNSPICQRFCTLFPENCKLPFQQWCSDINSWKNGPDWNKAGTCYATAYAVSNTVQQNSVVPTLFNLCSDKTLDADPCLTFCFTNNTNNLNCGPALKQYCGTLMRDEILNQSQLLVEKIAPLSSLVPATYSETLFTPTNTPPAFPYSSGAQVQVKDAAELNEDYNYHNFQGYVVFESVNISRVYPVNYTDSKLREHFPAGKTYPLRLQITTFELTDYLITIKGSGMSGDSLDSGQIVQITANSVNNVTDQTQLNILNVLLGTHYIDTFSAVGANWTLTFVIDADKIDFDNIPLTTITNLNAFFGYQQPYLFGPNGYQVIPFSFAGMDSTPPYFRVKNNFESLNSNLAIPFTSNIGSIASLVTFELNVFNVITTNNNKIQLSLSLKESEGNPEGDNNIPRDTFTVTSFRINPQTGDGNFFYQVVLNFSPAQIIPGGTTGIILSGFSPAYLPLNCSFQNNTITQGSGELHIFVNTSLTPWGAGAVINNTTVTTQTNAKISIPQQESDTEFTLVSYRLFPRNLDSQQNSRVYPCEFFFNGTTVIPLGSYVTLNGFPQLNNTTTPRTFQGLSGLVTGSAPGQLYIYFPYTTYWPSSQVFNQVIPINNSVLSLIPQNSPITNVLTFYVFRFGNNAGFGVWLFLNYSVFGLSNTVSFTNTGFETFANGDYASINGNHGVSRPLNVTTNALDVNPNIYFTLPASTVWGPGVEFSQFLTTTLPQILNPVYPSANALVRIGRENIVPPGNDPVFENLAYPYDFVYSLNPPTSFTLSNIGNTGYSIFQTGGGPNIPKLAKSPDGNFVSYSNEIVANAANAVYSQHPQCPCFMPTWVYNHYYNDLISEFPQSPELNAFIQNLEQKPTCTYPQCTVLQNGATPYFPRAPYPQCDPVAVCLQNAQINVQTIGYVVQTNFSSGSADQVVCDNLLTTFTVFNDTRLLSPINPTFSFWDCLNDPTNTGLITLPLVRGNQEGNSIPVIPAPLASFRGYITGTTLFATRQITGPFPPNMPSSQNTLYGLGLQQNTFITTSPVLVSPGIYSYTINTSQNVGDSGNQVAFTINGNNVTFTNAAPTYYVNDYSTNTVNPVNYKIGDSVHIYETNQWQTMQTDMTPILGYITGNVLYITQNNGPVGPGAIRSTNLILPNTEILSLLSGVGTPYLGAGSQWRINKTYTNNVGTSTNPIPMFVSVKSVPRYAYGYVYDLPTPVAGAYTMVVQIESTNEDENQLSWSSTSTNYNTLNSSGQLATHLSIGHDIYSKSTEGGQDITPITWETVYNPSKYEGVQNTPYFSNKYITQESGSNVLIVVVLIIALSAGVILLMTMLFRKNGLLKKMTIHKNINEIKEAHEITKQVTIKKAQAKLEAPQIIIPPATMPSITALQSNPSMASQFLPDLSSLKQSFNDSLNSNINSINDHINDKVKNSLASFSDKLKKYGESYTK